jgi:hypothetical protein
MIICADKITRSPADEIYAKSVKSITSVLTALSLAKLRRIFAHLQGGFLTA